MSNGRDRDARFCRLARGKNSVVAVGVAAGNTTLEGNCVAFNLQNASENVVVIRADGTAATLASGWTLAAGAQTGWIDCVGGLVISTIADVAASRLDVWQILDEAP